MDWQKTALLALIVYSVVISVLYVRRSRRFKYRLKKALTRNTGRHAATLQAADEAKFQAAADEALKLTQTFQKFVPRQFVEHMATTDVESLELGYAAENDVAIMFCDIRGFAGFSERITPQELMNFLNSYFTRMNDPIHQNRGFIDKFMGDGIMALFDHQGGTPQQKALDAIQAALDLRKALTVYNGHRKNCDYEPINMGIGIHFGPVIMGTVGSEDRMDTTVIGDSVNIASRLEALTPKYQADIIVSAQVLQIIGPGYPVHTRLLDWVRVKGRKTPIEIYEVLSHLPEEERERKLSIQTKIAAGVACRINQQWDEAIAFFETALAMNPDDSLAHHHLDVCRVYRNLDLAVDWDGALVL
ncbi:adenylate/guanylate cyclase domain-containing protein [Alteromonas sp. ALT199]|uniref:adenylate/guanylate cyclase domain-containing protein n=1 Tax=unclassified Alteromonas TaxID=2614992 RepID=UPI0004522C30|nr:adenylate/guanylate cyclase domain-containing protein [Alteromonas sp. ALT199]MBT3135748.1 adenylate/guanylate cyclase domain-containing protein [Alteromonas sp. ALT199]